MLEQVSSKTLATKLWPNNKPQMLALSSTVQSIQVNYTTDPPADYKAYAVFDVDKISNTQYLLFIA